MIFKFNSPFSISIFLNFQFQGEQGRHAANNREHHAALRYNKLFLEEVAQEGCGHLILFDINPHDRVRYAQVLPLTFLFSSKFQ